MKLRNTLWVALASLGLVACMHLAPAPSFNQRLGQQYQRLSSTDGTHMYTWLRADHFTAKSRMAYNGVDVQPENPETWNVPREYLPEINNAYDMLQIALVPDQKKVTDPVNAADAQAYFDCWVEQAHRNWTPTNPTSDCRAAFYRAMCRMYKGRCNESAAVTTMIDKNRIFRVYFDTDKSNIDAADRAVINEAVASYRKGASEVVVAGHADRQGSGAYNLALSKRRAANVKAALISAGIPASKINGKYFGEEQPLVSTPDEVPNGNNRRVLIVVR